MRYILIIATIVFTVAGQLLLKSASRELGRMPSEFEPALAYLLNSFLNTKVIVGFVSAFLAACAWIGAVSLSDLSFAYPFMAVPIVLVVVMAALGAGESISLLRWLGVLLVAGGLVLVARG